MQFDLIRQIARKELGLFFSSPIGYLFLAVFLAVTLFMVFWVETFFARNVADVRPMFEWMPVLLLFLCAALTMRMWSEERRTGTLEFVSTVPVRTWHFVLGKFAACLALLGLALLLTLPLPLTVAYIADLDWGPVWAGYLAALLLGAAYLAIGLFVSARTDSQIVSLILAVLISGLFYLAGSGILDKLVSGPLYDVLRGIGTGSRFESITRGVLDLRDLYYYLSLAGAFLALNVLALEMRRWAVDGAAAAHRAWLLGTALLVANLLLANVWLAPLNKLRYDATEGQIFSISTATRGYLDQLQEPLLIRGYFSSKTHPYLAPLVPRMRDLLNEYAVAGGDRVRVEVIDPAENPELEDEANSKYGIQPTPFQVADRYQSSLVNSYFDILISYGDQYEVLGFRDLIEVKMLAEDDMNVQLRNPEFDITRAIKKVLYGFQGGNSLFSSLSHPVRFTGYISADADLPEQLVAFRAELTRALDGLVAESDGRFAYDFVDPRAGDGALAQELADLYGFRPMALSLFDETTFYFYLTLSDSETVVQVPLPQALSEEAAKRALEEGLKRYAKGLLKSIALVTPPPANPYAAQLGQGSGYEQLKGYLQDDFNLLTTDLAEGVVPPEAELLMVVAPEALGDKQRFAIDQFLMRGGTVVLATAPFEASVSQNSLTVSPRTSGLEEWLAHQGITLAETLVMDPQNAAFPVPVTRQVGGFSFQDFALLDYPYFPDIRGEGLDNQHPVTASLPQVTLSWASPIDVSVPEGAARQSHRLLSSSAGSWLSDDTNVMPRVDAAGASGFVPAGEQAAWPLAVVLEGRFDSYYAGQPSPLLEAESDTDAEQAEDADTAATPIASVIERSPESARLVVIASNDFLSDQILQFIGSAEGTFYTHSVQLMANLADWSLEDQSLMSIRSRGQFNRTLPPLPEGRQALLEYGNYVLALLGIGLVLLWYRQRQSRRRQQQENWLKEARA